MLLLSEASSRPGNVDFDFLRMDKVSDGQVGLEDFKSVRM